MDSQVFKNVIQHAHHRWLGKILQLDSDGRARIDLVAPNLGIEVKARHRDYESHGWALAAYQYCDFPQAMPSADLYWAFILYTLTKSIATLKPREAVQNLVRRREVWFQPWSWAEQFPESTPKTGPYRYVSVAAVRDARDYVHFRMKGGILHIPRETSLEQRINDIHAGREPVPF